MPAKKKLILELFRKSFHLLGVFLILGYTLVLNIFSKGLANLALVVVLLVTLEIEHIRIEHKPKFAEKLKKYYRKHEQNHISSTVFFIISLIICFAVFNYWIAVLAMFMTVFGDIFAAIFGRAFGKIKFYKNKTIIGTLSGLAANLIVGFLVLPETLIVVPMAIVATSTEVITNKLDDNLTVPLFAGFIGEMIVKYYSINLPPLEFTIPGIF